MKIQVIFGTVEGQTGKIAEFVAKHLREAGHDVELFDTASTARIPADAADKVILAASVHERRHPKNFEIFLAASKGDLSKRPTLMLSVSLSAAFEEGREDAQDYLTEMEMRTGFSADRQLLVAGAVRRARYDYFARQVVRHVVLRGKPVEEDLGQDMEFTDWDQLQKTVSEFVAA